MANQNLQTVSVDFGKPNKLNDNGPVTTTGQFEFYVPAHKGEGCDFSAIFVAQGTLTGLVADLQVSVDNGVTYPVTLVANVLVAATPFKVVTQTIIGGLKYRLNITANTGSIDFFVAFN